MFEGHLSRESSRWLVARIEAAIAGEEAASTGSSPRTAGPDRIALDVGREGGRVALRLRPPTASTFKAVVVLGLVSLVCLGFLGDAPGLRCDGRGRCEVGQDNLVVGWRSRASFDAADLQGYDSWWTRCWGGGGEGGAVELPV